MRSITIGGLLVQCIHLRYTPAPLVIVDLSIGIVRMCVRWSHLSSRQVPLRSHPQISTCIPSVIFIFLLQQACIVLYTKCFCIATAWQNSEYYLPLEAATFMIFF